MKRCKHGMVELWCSERTPNKVTVTEDYTTVFKNKEGEKVRWKRTRTRTIYDN